MNLTAIMQPTFFPWIGYFDLIDQVESFVFYDDVQLVKRSWQVRNRIKSANGELFLTIPIKKNKTRDELLISEAEIAYDENWQSKHLKSIESAYKKADHFTVYLVSCLLITKKNMKALPYLMKHLSKWFRQISG
jgi:hypothetical protein